MKIKKTLLTLFVAFLVFYSCEKDNTEDNLVNIATVEIKNVTTYSAESKSEITGNEKLSILSRGVCWSMYQEPTIMNSHTLDSLGFGTYTSKVYNLQANTTYYIRPYYISNLDTVYGTQSEFSTPDYIQFNTELEYGTVTDIDGNVYKTIQIGDQVWMAENLRTIRYQNGDSVHHVLDLLDVRTAAYTYYNNDETNKVVHGALYNSKVALDSRNIAPKGWHVARVEDWEQLVDYLESNVSKKYSLDLREITTAHWSINKIIGHISTNSTGFSSIGSGRYFGEFMDIGVSAHYWTSSISPYDVPYCVELYFNLDITFTAWIDTGMSIRCVKDEK